MKPARTPGRVGQRIDPERRAQGGDFGLARGLRVQRADPHTSVRLSVAGRVMALLRAATSHLPGRAQALYTERSP